MAEAREGPLRSEDRRTSNDKRLKRDDSCVIDERKAKGKERRGEERVGKEMCAPDPSYCQRMSSDDGYVFSVYIKNSSKYYK